MKIEIYTENEVSKVDRERCYTGFKNQTEGTYCIVGKCYVIYKDVAIVKVLQLAKFLGLL